jgi:hypothetical protein
MIKQKLNKPLNFLISLTLLVSLGYNIQANFNHRTLFSFANIVKFRESVWLGNPYGDLSSYSIFFTNNLLIDSLDHYDITIPYNLNSKLEIFDQYRPDYLSYYLFPIRIKHSSHSNTILNNNEFYKLMQRPFVTYTYRELSKTKLVRRFVIIKDFSALSDNKWGLYLYKDKNILYVLTLPLNWKTQLELNN